LAARVRYSVQASVGMPYSQSAASLTAFIYFAEMRTLKVNPLTRAKARG
jgi:hypothetical protein